MKQTPVIYPPHHRDSPAVIPLKSTGLPHSTQRIKNTLQTSSERAGLKCSESAHAATIAACKYWTMSKLRKHLYGAGENTMLTVPGDHAVTVHDHRTTVRELLRRHRLRVLVYPIVQLCAHGHRKSYAAISFEELQAKTPVPSLPR
jgi:hypothetical protein